MILFFLGVKVGAVGVVLIALSLEILSRWLRSKRQ